MKWEKPCLIPLDSALVESNPTCASGPGKEGSCYTGPNAEGWCFGGENHDSPPH